MDLGLCGFKATVVCCPPVLKTGDDIILHVKCYLLDRAFNEHAMAHGVRMGNGRSIWNRGLETVEERSSSERTLALLSIIRSVHIVPSRSAMHRMNMTLGQNDDDLQDLISQALKISTTSDESSEDREPEETEVSANDLNNIYQKAQIFDSQISEMVEPETMALSLKQYQKRVRWISLVYHC